MGHETTATVASAQDMLARVVVRDQIQVDLRGANNFGELSCLVSRPVFSFFSSSELDSPTSPHLDLRPSEAMGPPSAACAVDGLPDELLSQILLTYARDEYKQWYESVHFMCMSLGGEEPPFGRPIPDPLTYTIKLATVCRRWRAVALECAPLWSNVAIKSASVAATSLLLERSKGSPLDVLCVMATSGMYGSTMTEQLSLVLQNLHRIRSLRLYLRSANVAEEPEALFDTLHAPLLKSMSVVYVGKNPDRQTWRIKIRDVGTKWIAPSLHYYAVHRGGDIPWAPETYHAPHFRETLTELIWLPSIESRNLCPSTETLLSVLRHLPHLVTLQIAVANRYPQTPIVSLVERSHVEAARLPNLRRLLLDGHIQICMDILEHLKYPEPLQQLIVAAGGSQKKPLPGSISVQDYIAELIQHDAQNTGNTPSLRPMRMLGLCADEELPDVARIMAYQEIKYPRRFPTSRHLDENGDERFYDMDLSLTLPDALPRAHLERLFGGVALNTAQILNVYAYIGDGRYLPHSWSKAVSALPEIQTLEMGNSITPKMVTTVLVSGGGAEGEVTHNFPHLKTIRLEGLEGTSFSLVVLYSSLLAHISCGR